MEYFLTEDDREALKSLLKWAKGRGISVVKDTRGNPGNTDLLPKASDVYIAVVPEGGIRSPSGLTGTDSDDNPDFVENVYSADCNIYHKISDGTSDLLVGVGSFKLAVYSLYPLSAGSIIQVHKDKFGTWWAISQIKQVWAHITSPTPQVESVSLGGRSISDGVIESGSTTLTSSTANFTSSDVSSVIACDGIPAATIIVSVTSPSKCVLSQYATKSATGLSAIIGQTGTLSAYDAKDASPITGINYYDSLTHVWLLDMNGFVPQVGRYYECRIATTDSYGKPIYIATLQTPPVVAVCFGGDGPNANKATQLKEYSMYAWPCNISNSPSSFIAAANAAWLIVINGNVPAYGVEYPAYCIGTTTTIPYGTQDPASSYNVYITYNYPTIIPGYQASSSNSKALSSGNILLGGNKLVIDSTNIQLGPPYILPGNIANPALGDPTLPFTALSINYGGVYQATTGTDGVGNIFVSGLNVSVGGVPGPGTGGGGDDRSLTTDFGRET